MPCGMHKYTMMLFFSPFELPLLAYAFCVNIQGGGVWRGIFWDCNGLRAGSSEGTAQCDTPPEGSLRLQRHK